VGTALKPWELEEQLRTKADTRADEAYNKQQAEM
jgi:hypothetical protein